jgi:hypothetical protein
MNMRVFHIVLKKKAKSITLGFVVIRLINASESQYNRIITVTTLQQIYPDLQINQKISKMQ